MPRKPSNQSDIIDEKKKSSKSKTTAKASESLIKEPKKSITKKSTSQSEEKSKNTKKSVGTTKEAAKTAKNSATNKSKTAKKVTASTKKNSADKSTAAKKTSSAKSVTKVTKSAKKTSSAKSTTKVTKSTKKTSSAKSTTKVTKSAKKTNSAKPATEGKKSTVTKKTRTSKSSKNEITSSTDLTKKIEVLEYYDLPYRYNQTIVKVLAQTPTTLFIYWDISDVDRASFVEQYGEDFFNNTKPVLVIHNDTMHYSFEIEIDDFANSWYLHVNDSNCEYTVELGRRPKYYNNEKHVNISNNYLYITSSNVIDAPNDHVLFDKDLKTVYFRDIKTNIVTAKDITSISFLRNMGKIYNLYDLQSDFTKNSWINSNHWQLDLKNPSSSNPSSTFK